MIGKKQPIAMLEKAEKKEKDAQRVEEGDCEECDERVRVRTETGFGHGHNGKDSDAIAK